MSDTLRRLRELEAAATSGPWVDEGDGCISSVRTGFWNACVCMMERSFHGSDWTNPDRDAALIAAMRNALPALLDVAEAARTLLDGLAQDEADDGSIRSFVQIGELDNALARLDGTGRGDAEKADS